MKTFLVSFTNADGVAQTRTVQALSAMIAVRMAHSQICEVGNLNNTVAIACTEQTE